MKQELLDVSLETNIKKEEGYLKALAYKLSKSQDDAQDLLQDTWVRIIENYPTYDNRNKFRSWASVIMKNIFINNFRSGKRKGVSVDIEYAKVCVVADNRNDANGLLAIYCNEHFENFDGRYCDFECFMTEMPFAEKEDNEGIIF